MKQTVNFHKSTTVDTLGFLFPFSVACGQQEKNTYPSLKMKKLISGIPATTILQAGLHLAESVQMKHGIASGHRTSHFGYQNETQCPGAALLIVATC